MTEYSALVYGIYPRSEGLRKNINLWERSKLSLDELRTKLADEKSRIYDFLGTKGLHFTDPLSNWHDILRPVALSMKGVSLGELRRYKETNTFYRQPVIDEYPSYSDLEPEDGFPYFPPFHDLGRNGAYAFLPGPYSFMHMSSLNDTLSTVKLLESLSVSFGDFLDAYGAKKVVIYEPLQYINADLGHLSHITERFETVLVASGSIKGTSPGNLLQSLNGISVRGGLETISDFTGDVYLQHMDSQNTRLEDSENLLRILDREKRNLKLNIKGITHTEYLDFLPRSIADRKIDVLKEVVSSE